MSSVCERCLARIGPGIIKRGKVGPATWTGALRTCPCTCAAYLSMHLRLRTCPCTRGNVGNACSRLNLLLAVAVGSCRVG